MLIHVYSRAALSLALALRENMLSRFHKKIYSTDSSWKVLMARREGGTRHKQRRIEYVNCHTWSVICNLTGFCEFFFFFTRFLRHTHSKFIIELR